MTSVHFEVTSFQPTFHMYSIMRPYIALDTDTPSRWENFATSHPEYKPLVWVSIVAPVHVNCYCVPSAKES
jgi:hypothetical protein